MKQEHLLIGEIVRAQGIRGEVKVKHFTDNPERFFDLPFAYQKIGDKYEKLIITSARVQKDDVYIMLENVHDRNKAESYRGTKLYVDRENAVALSEDEVFIVDILGALAEDTQGNAIGTLKDVLTPGGVDVFVFETPTGTLMVPALKTVLLTLDAENGRIVLDEQKLLEVGLYEDRRTHTIS